MTCGLLLPLAAAEDPWALERRSAFTPSPAQQVEDVRQVFGLVGDGKADDTAALQKAVNRQGGPFIWLPNGTYLVRDRIRYEGKVGYAPAIVGESRDGVIIRLADDAKGFSDPAKPRALLQLVPGEVGDKRSADFFKTKLRNLTLDTGRHAGAIGLVFYANNNGTCRNVCIRGQGAVGLDLSWQLNGPLLVANVEVLGFAVGVKAGSGPFNSQIIEHLRLRGQKVCGIDNDGECLSIRDLESDNAVPAMKVVRGATTLLDADLKGGSKEGAAIIAAGRIVLRQVSTTGYGRVLQEEAVPERNGKGKERTTEDPAPVLASLPGGRVEEWTNGPRVRPAAPQEPAATLRLPVEVPPWEPAGDPHAWVAVDAFGAVPDDKIDDSEAVRQALVVAASPGKGTVCFRPGTYRISGTFAIPAGVRWLQGANSFLAPDPVQGARLELGEGADPLTIDLLDRVLGPKLRLTVENRGPRTLVLRHLRCNLDATGPGRSFSDDASGSIQLSHSEARVWVRSLNSEGVRGEGQACNLNQGGRLWVLGLKSEKTHCLLETKGGQSEILGGWVYVIGAQAPSEPMFRVVDASLSLAGLIQYHFAGKVYPVLVDERQGGTAITLNRERNQGQAGIGIYRSR